MVNYILKLAAAFHVACVIRHFNDFQTYLKKKEKKEENFAAYLHSTSKHEANLCLPDKALHVKNEGQISCS